MRRTSLWPCQAIRVCWLRMTSIQRSSGGGALVGAAVGARVGACVGEGEGLGVAVGGDVGVAVAVGAGVAVAVFVGAGLAAGDGEQLAGAPGSAPAEAGPGACSGVRTTLQAARANARTASMEVCRMTLMVRLRRMNPLHPQRRRRSAQGSLRRC